MLRIRDQNIKDAEIAFKSGVRLMERGLHWSVSVRACVVLVGKSLMPLQPRGIVVLTCKVVLC